MKYSKLTWLFTLPSLLAFIIVMFIPMLTGFYYSMTEWNGISETQPYVGFSNYVKVLTNDPEFIQSFIFTAKFAVISVILINLLGFFLALIVNQEFKGRNVYRSIFFMPNLIGGVLLGFAWLFIFTSIFSAISKATGIGWLDGWLSTTTTGFWGLVIVMVWQMSG